MNIFKAIFMSIISLLFSLSAFANEVSGDVDCKNIGEAPYYFECRLLIGVEYLQEVGAFRAQSLGWLEEKKPLLEHLSVFQYVLDDSLHFRDRVYRFWVYNSRDQKVVFSGMADMPIRVLDIDGKKGNEILVRSKIAEYPANNIIAYEYIPHLTAYSILEGNTVNVLDPLKFAAFSMQWKEKLDSFAQFFKDRKELLIEFRDEGRIGASNSNEIEEYISLQLQLIDYQRKMLCSENYEGRYPCLK